MDRFRSTSEALSSPPPRGPSSHFVAGSWLPNCTLQFRQSQHRGSQLTTRNKTATFTVKGRYHLPVADLPWPVKALSQYSVPVNVQDVQLQVEPDHSAPTPSPTDRGDVDDTKYHVTKVSVPSHTPRNRVLALVYNIM